MSFRLASQQIPSGGGDGDWQRSKGTDSSMTPRGNGNSVVNLIHSNSMSMSHRAPGGSGNGVGSATPSRTRSLQRPRVETLSDSDAQFSGAFYFNPQGQPQHQPHQGVMQPYAVHASLTGSLVRRGPPMLQRQLSDRYQYNRDHTEVDSMG